MEEGRRMFHIFAARMFEQRVLAAYREKVARERQQKLLEEIEEEDRKAEEKNSKKAKEKERKKERQRLQKQQKEDERLRKEAERAAEEAARRQEEEDRAEEQRKQKEAARLKREAERKQQDADRLKKEEERRKRQAEERDRQQEIERKRREKEEATKKRREEDLKKVKDAKDLREREAREKKEREERERREKESKKTSTPARRQSTPASPPRTVGPQPAIPKIPTPGLSSVPPPANTPPHSLTNGSLSTPGTHSPSPRVSVILPPQLHSQHVGQQSSHYHVPIQPPPGAGFSSPTMRNQFPPIHENLGPNVHPHMMTSPMQQGRPSNVGVPPMVNGLPLGIYSPLPIGNPNQYGRFPPNQQAGYSPGNLPALPHLARGYDGAPPGTPTYPSPIGSMPSHGSPILPPPSKAVESGMSSPQVSHSRKTSIDAMSDLSGSLGSLGPRHLPGMNGSGPPPGLSRTIQRPAPIQRPQSTTSSGRGSRFVQDEEMGMGSRALLDDGVEDLAKDEIIEPSSGSAPGFGQTRRANAFPSLGDKLWPAPPSSSDNMWGRQDKNSLLWGNAPSSATEESAFPNWDARPSFSSFQLTPLQERIKDFLIRTDPMAYHPLESVVAHLQRQYPMDRVNADDVLQATQAAPTFFLVMPKDRTPGSKWVIRSLNPADSRQLAGARLMTVLGPKPGTPPNDLGRNMLGSLAEVVRGFD
jgi:actin-related protein